MRFLGRPDKGVSSNSTYSWLRSGMQLYMNPIRAGKSIFHWGWPYYVRACHGFFPVLQMGVHLLIKFSYIFSPTLGPA